MTMKLTVDIYELDGAANDVKVGEIRFDGEKIITSSDDKLLMRMAGVPIEVDGKVIDPEHEPEKFIRNLWQHYFGPYLRAMKATTLIFVLAIAVVTATAQTPEPNLQADLALAAARLAEATEPAPEPCAWRYVANPDMDADAIELAPEEQVQPKQFFSTPPLERPRGTPEDVVPVRVFQFREEGWKFWGWLLLPMKDVQELHEDLVST